MCSDNLFYHSEGYACFSGDTFKLMNHLDQTFKSLINDFDYEEYHIPALIDGSVLEKCGYFSSFPQHLTVAAYTDEKYFESIVNEKKVSSEYLRSSHKYLTPAACLHIYPMLEDSLPENKVITTKARVYRYEGARFTTLTRLWDFTVREIVFVGTPEFVQEKLNILKERVLAFAQKITASARINNASDHFFNSQENKIKSKIQKVNSLKFELTVPIKDIDVALASFNSHHTHFSRPFQFDQEGQIVTACVGFGLERWIAACLEHQYNFNTGDDYNE